MLTLGAFAFAAPWMLLALGALPVLWWLLKLTPPAPRLVRFPAVRLLFGLRQDEETPARTPLWIVLLRFLLATLIIFALAQPLLNPRPPLAGSGPLVLVVDTGWAAAPRWQDRRRAIAELIDQAARANRAVVAIEGAPPATGEALVLGPPLHPDEVRRRVRSLLPHPWPSDRAAVETALQGYGLEGAANVFWLTDGLATGGEAALAARLQRLGSLTVLRDAPEALARMLAPPTTDGGALVVRVARAVAGAAETAPVLASAEDGRVLARETARFEPDETTATLRLALPLELRNRITRLEIDGEATAGAVILLDERWRRRPVGLFSVGTQARSLPLLAELYYLERALEPFSEVRVGTLDALLDRDLAVIIVPDSGPLPEPDQDRLAAWAEAGGVLLRFAGPRLAQAADALIPVALRRGGRAFGGAMSWAQPARLAPFGEASPFAGLVIPDDVTVERQVLAQPALDLEAKTWARLEDGTPLVTAERRGQGWLVLFHTTANPDWSGLSLSGLFVEMLRRVSAVSHGVAQSSEIGPLQPLEVLDGFGRAGPPSAIAIAIDGARLAETDPGPRTPPGLYGNAAAHRAFNLSARVDPPRPIGRLPDGVRSVAYGASPETDLRPWLLAMALAIGLVDLVLSLGLRGLLAWPRALATMAVLGVLGAAGGPGRADDRAAVHATRETHLAFARTDVAAVDEVSEAGLVGLTEVINVRTSVELGAPIAVDVERDELAFFPLIYWPIVAEQRPLSAAAVKRLNRYLTSGGAILIDTRDQHALMSPGSTGGNTARTLRRLLGRLGIPPLVPVPADHVLTKAFYLIQAFPGRWTGGKVWVEGAGSSVNDGVSPIVIGGHDWAGAWAVDRHGNPLFPVVPGGEKQREMAYRFGVNLVLYILAGNYKADQVHIRTILERLDQ